MGGTDAAPSWFEKLIDFATKNDVSWAELVVGICAVVVVLRLPAILKGIAEIIRASTTNNRETKEGRRKLGLEKATNGDKIAEKKEDD